MRATDWHAMQAAESTIDGTKARRAPGDVNVKQMSMGSWRASLSHGGAAIAKLGSQNNAGAAVLAQKKKR